MLVVPLLKMFLLYAGCLFVKKFFCMLVVPLLKIYLQTSLILYIYHIITSLELMYFFFLSFRFNIFKVVGLHLESVSDNISQLYTIVHSQVHTEEVLSPCLCQTDIKIYFHIWHNKYILMYDIIIPFSKTCKINCLY
jgi:hypothetical protein